MPARSLVFGNHSPFPSCRRLIESRCEFSDRFHPDRRPVNQRDHRGVAAAAENFLKADPQRAELPTRRIRICHIRIYHQRCPIRIRHRSQCRFILTGDDQHEINVRKQHLYGSGEERASQFRACRLRRPRQQRWVAPHA